jgi:hypothetical protein
MLTEQLKDLSVEELTELKTEIASLLKKKKEAEKNKLAQEKEKRATWAKENLEVGDLVNFTYKQEVLEGEVCKLTEKGFTVAFEYEGEDKVLSRLFSLFVEKVSEIDE